MEVLSKRLRSPDIAAISHRACRISNCRTLRQSKLPSTAPTCSAATKRPDEIEIKLRLPNQEAHDKLATALRPQLKATHQQENIFFDGANQELSSQKTIVRCRFYNVDKRALLTIKGKQELKEGIGRGTEVEEDIDPVIARKFVSDPDRLLTFESSILQPLLKQHAVTRMVCIGGFKNERKDFSWEGCKLELDKTMFAHGTVYEVEVESEHPDELKTKLEGFLSQKHIPFTYSKSTKFGNFINKTLE